MSFINIVIVFLGYLRMIAVLPLSKAFSFRKVTLGILSLSLNFNMFYVMVLVSVRSIYTSFAPLLPSFPFHEFGTLPTRIKTSISQNFGILARSLYIGIKAYISTVAYASLKAILSRFHPGFLRYLRRTLEANIDSCTNPDVWVQHILGMLDEIGYCQAKRRRTRRRKRRGTRTISEVSLSNFEGEGIDDLTVLGLDPLAKAGSENKQEQEQDANDITVSNLVFPLEDTIKGAPILDAPHSPLNCLPPASPWTLVCLNSSATPTPTTLSTSSTSVPLSLPEPTPSDGRPKPCQGPLANPLVSFDLSDSPLKHLKLEGYQPIGEGACGAIYKGTNGERGLVAVKIIQRLPCFSGMIMEEIRAMCRADSSPWAPYLEGCRFTKQEVVIAMTYYAEGTLADLWSAHDGTISPQLTIFYAAEMILALHDIHSRGVVHRDIKFQNIMLYYGHIKIIDFGLAATFDHESVSSSDYPTFTALRARGGDAFPLLFPGVCNPFTVIHPCGTRGFSAPEVWKGEKYSFGVDYFAVGSILHTFLTRKLPFVYDFEISDYDYDKILVDPENVLDEVQHDFLSKMLAEDPYGRLDVGDMKQHQIFQNINWKALVEGRARPPLP